jgi:Polyketide cyclase / dehydrase and lipid transport
VETNESAPAVGSAEIEVVADPDVVWEVLTAIEAWPGWNPDVTSASLEGELAEGSRFRWRSGRTTITSTLERVDRPRLIAWTGRAFGLRAIHVYKLDPYAGHTRVSSDESWEGPVAQIFRRRMQKTLERAMEAGLIYLKEEAERRAA